MAIPVSQSLTLSELLSHYSPTSLIFLNLSIAGGRPRGLGGLPVLHAGLCGTRQHLSVLGPGLGTCTELQIGLSRGAVRLPWWNLGKEGVEGQYHLKFGSGAGEAQSDLLLYCRPTVV